MVIIYEIYTAIVTLKLALREVPHYFLILGPLVHRLPHGIKQSCWKIKRTVWFQSFTSLLPKSPISAPLEFLYTYLIPKSTDLAFYP